MQQDPTPRDLEEEENNEQVRHPIIYFIKRIHFIW